MEVKRTVPVKLDTPDDRRDDLRTTIEQFNHAANYTVEHGRNDDRYLILNKSKIHDRVYHDLRDRPTREPLRPCVLQSGGVNEVHRRGLEERQQPTTSAIQRTVCGVRQTHTDYQG